MKHSRSPFHAGEREVQRRAGVAEDAEAVGDIVADVLSPGAARFVSGQRFAIASSLDGGGRPWASVLSGPAGFLEAMDEHLLRIGTHPASDDPLLSNLRVRPELGLLVLDPQTRRRMRLNGRGLVADDTVFLLADEVYGNCPKYIQKRRLAGEATIARQAAVAGDRLDARQRAWIARADTVFVASFHPDGGADASHRGGNPGFVRVRDDRRIEIPDYSGNAMFNTLGNLLQYPRVGLLFVDFANGDTLQLTGRAEVRFEPARLLAIEVDEVRETRAGHRLVWELVEPSPTNPAV